VDTGHADMRTKQYMAMCLDWSEDQWPEEAYSAREAAEQFAVTGWDNMEVGDPTTIRVVVCDAAGVRSGWTVTGDRGGAKAVPA